MSDDLKRLLAELDRQLDAAPELDDDTRALLLGAQQDIEQALQRGRRKMPNIARRLEDAIVRFEAEHPILTNTVHRLVLSML